MFCLRHLWVAICYNAALPGDCFLDESMPFTVIEALGASATSLQTDFIYAYLRQAKLHHELSWTFILNLDWNIRLGMSAWFWFTGCERIEGIIPKRNFQTFRVILQDRGLVPNSESVGFQSLRPGSGDRKMHAPKNRNSTGETLLEPCWNLTLVEPCCLVKPCSNLAGTLLEPC